MNLSPEPRPRLTPELFGDHDTPPSAAFPLEGRPGWYRIGQDVVGPDFVFSLGARLKGNPYKKAKAYVIAESVRLHGAIVCELGEHYLTERTAEVHHRVKNDLHVARALGVACHSHNAVAGKPGSASPSETRERESAAATVPIVIDLNVRIYDHYQKWLDDRLVKEAGGVLLNEAIYTAAREIHEELGHGAHQTIRGYLQTLTTGADAPFWIDDDKKVHRRTRT